MYKDAVKAELQPNIFKHSLALQACMGGIFDHLKTEGMLGESELPKEDWLLAGLIHDIDYNKFPSEHPNKVKEVLAEHNLEVTKEVLNIVLTHSPDTTGVQPQTQAEWAIFCADSLTGLIIAVALILPSRKLGDVKLKSVMKRFLKQPKFAAGTRREEVKMCEEKLKIELEQFVEICLKSMQEIATELGL